MHHGYSSAVCSHAGGLVLQDSEPHDCTGEKTDRARGVRDDGLNTLLGRSDQTYSLDCTAVSGVRCPDCTSTRRNAGERGPQLSRSVRKAQRAEERKPEPNIDERTTIDERCFGDAEPEDCGEPRKRLRGGARDLFDLLE